MCKKLQLPPNSLMGSAPGPCWGTPVPLWVPTSLVNCRLRSNIYSVTILTAKNVDDDTDDGT